MERYLTNITESPPPRIIPGVERSRPPSYSPELATLLTSTHSRTLTKPLKHTALKNPPTLPERANPSSEEARILGPFSKRREVNIRWRYHTGEIKRTYYPLELSEPDDPEYKHNLRGTGAECLALLKEVEDLARSPLPIPGRKRDAKADTANLVTHPYQQEKFDSSLPNRFLRRRYRELLARIPILIPDKNTQYGAKTTWSPLALVSSDRNVVQYGIASEEDIDWIIKADKADKEARNKK
ncbi:hypothetical protein Clacol_004095 [Clathrus columnatus]|uniref:Uncharacterized protein n=1 Tax=Clathrus columnatus TaxID=1419009 RepID=A0AAV5A5F1_9AGAM|nr:hypothetical protein Clacol_004095 [Clathrus columnatus]